jgi:hypothetical protein
MCVNAVGRILKCGVQSGYPVQSDMLKYVLAQDV